MQSSVSLLLKIVESFRYLLKAEHYKRRFACRPTRVLRVSLCLPNMKIKYVLLKQFFLNDVVEKSESHLCKHLYRTFTPGVNAEYLTWDLRSSLNWREPIYCQNCNLRNFNTSLLLHV